MEFLTTIGVNLPLFIAFGTVCFISWFFADDLIQFLYDRRFDDIISKKQCATCEKGDEHKGNWRKELNLQFGKQIGQIERIFYIYAFMLNAFGLLAAWFILKAFFGWIQKYSGDSLGVPIEQKELTTFYLYIYGNALSLLTAMLLGHAGLIFEKLLVRCF